MNKTVAGLCLCATLAFSVPGQVDESLLDEFSWRAVGPAGAGGRIVAIDVVVAMAVVVGVVVCAVVALAVIDGVFW